jgi:hypothetical protein
MTSVSLVAQQQTPNRVVGTFEVVDTAGKLVMRVGSAAQGTTRGAYFYNASGQIVAMVTAPQDQGGLIKAIRAGDDKNGASLSAFSEAVGLTIRVNDTVRAHVGTNEQGKVSAEVLNAQSRAIASLGEGPAAAGSLLISSGTGAPQVVAEALQSGGALSVADAAGQPVMRVGAATVGRSRGAYFTDSAGKIVAVVTAPPVGGGVVKVIQAGDETKSASISVADGKAALIVRISGDKETAEISDSDGPLALRVKAAGQVVAELGTGTSGTEGGHLRVTRPNGQSAAEIASRTGRMGLRVTNDAGKVVAAMGISPETPNTGAVKVSGETGKVMAAMTTAAGGDRGAIAVLNPAGQTVAEVSSRHDGRGLISVYSAGVLVGTLTEGDSGGGLLQLSAAGGTPMVEAGSTTNGVGVVRTGPMPRPLLPGVPGSFIIGRK